MWFFGKDKKKGKSKKTSASKGADDPALAGKTEAQRALLMQMRGLRAEIGEENLQKLAKKLQFEDLKNKVRHDIETDEEKRNRLLDEIRMNLHDDK